MPSQMNSSEQTRQPWARASVPRRRRLAAVASVLLVLSACGLGMTSAERLDRGRSAFAEGDHRAAAIDARSVLQKEPDNLGARLLLGRSALRLGDPESARKELERAIELGQSRTDVMLDLAEAALLLGDFPVAVDEVDISLLAADTDRVRGHQLRGDASLGLGNPEAARAEFSAALRIDEQNAEAMLGVVESYMTEGRPEQARATLEQIRGIHPNQVELWLESGSLNLMFGTPSAALNDFRQASDLAATQNNETAELAALMGQVESMLLLSNLDEAEVVLAQLESRVVDASTHLLRGRLEFSRQNWEAAQRSVQESLRIAPEFRPAQMLLGATHLNRGNLEQAEMYLSAVVAASPEDADARRLLAETQIQLQKHDLASDALRPLISEGSTDTRALAAAARASLATGDFAAAQNYMQRRTEANPNDESLSLDLAATYLASGDVREAEALLETIDAGSDFDDRRREYLLIMAQVRSGAYDDAETAAGRLVDRWPEDAQFRLLLGGIQSSMGDVGAAAKTYGDVLNLEPTNVAARMSLGDMELAAGNLDAARRHFERALAASDSSVAPMIALAKTAGGAGDAQATEEWLQRARAADSRDALSRLYLGRYYLSTNQLDQANEVALEAAEIAPVNANIANLLGRVQMASGNIDEGVAALRQASSAEPENSGFRFDYVRSLVAARRMDDARSILDELDAASDGSDLMSRVRLAVLRAESGDSDAGIREARDLQAQYPDNPMPWLLEGELLYNFGDARYAAAAYDNALARRPDERLAIRAYGLRQQHGVHDAEAPLRDLLQERPDAVAARLTLAQAFHGRADLTTAIAEYERVLTVAPGNVVALNNLAWAYFATGDERAEDIARRAFAEEPDSDSIMDTLGWILARSGKLDEGIGLLRQASEMSGGRGEVAYHLAYALSEQGKRDEAKSILEAALGSGATFNSRDDAEALLATL